MSRPASAPDPRDAVVAAVRADLTRAVRRICPPGLQADADDIVQAATLKALRTWERSGQVPTAGWLRRAAYCEMIDELRRRRGVRAAPPDDLADADPPDAAPSPEAIAGGLQIGVAIRDCVAGLGEGRRHAVTLWLQGHTVPDAATLLGVAPKNAENLVYRGLADLRACLQGKGVTP